MIKKEKKSIGLVGDEKSRKITQCDVCRCMQWSQRGMSIVTIGPITYDAPGDKSCVDSQVF